MKAITLALALMLAACEAPEAVPGAEGPKVTLSQFNQIKEGMTYDAVVGVLGSPGVQQSSSDIGGIKTVMYAWNGEGTGANMNAMFQDDKLIQKAQFGLR